MYPEVVYVVMRRGFKNHWSEPERYDTVNSSFTTEEVAEAYAKAMTKKTGTEHYVIDSLHHSEIHVVINKYGNVMGIHYDFPSAEKYVSKRKNPQDYKIESAAENMTKAMEHARLKGMSHTSHSKSRYRK